jgi:hypothetical protein
MNRHHDGFQKVGYREVTTRINEWGGGSEVLLEVWRAPLDLFSESFEYKKKTELVQISIQMRIYTVGGKVDALPSAPGESVFKRDKK